MDKNKILTHFGYDPDTGLFVRLKSRRTDRIGKVCGSIDSSGYIQIKVFGKEILAHRLAFLFMTGMMPKDCVDHINRIRTDNRWCNLRDATSSQNSINKNTRSQTGCIGVQKIGNRFQSKISYRVNGVKVLKHLGMFSTPEKAQEAYFVARKKRYGSFV